MDHWPANVLPALGSDPPLLVQSAVARVIRYKQGSQGLNPLGRNENTVLNKSDIWWTKQTPLKLYNKDERQ